MQNLNWDDLRHFLAVAKNGSVTQAGKKLKVSYTTVSRRVAALEQELDTVLFDREEGNWSLTSAGAGILRAVEAMAEYASEVHLNALSETNNIDGRLRITSLGLIIEKFLLSDLKDFQAAYPNIKLELIASNDPLSLSAREADFAFRFTAKPPPHLIGTKIGAMVFGIYGSQETLELFKNNTPVSVITRIDDGHSLPNWISTQFPRAPSILRNDSIEVAIAACKEGFGAARLPCFYADPDPALYRLPGAKADRQHDLWMLSHSDLRRTPRMRLFRDFIRKRLEQKVSLLEGREGNYD